MYEEIAGPPVTVGAVNETVAWPFPRTALTPVGASGLPAGVIAAEVAGAEVPVELLAVTLKVYEVPLVNGAIEQVVAGAMIVQLPVPDDAVTVYEEGAPPPLPAPTVIVAPPSVPVAVTVGTSGARISHSAIKVALLAPITTGAFASRTVVPSLQPSKVNDARAKLVAPSRVTEVLASATVAAGSAPDVIPSTL